MSARLDAIAELGNQTLSASWLKQLKPAEFRNVRFQVDTIDWTVGDNLVIREYPFQDLPTVFTMGTAAEYIKFAAYVIGDDYHLQRERLVAALVGVGGASGLLVHPTAGTLRVHVADKFTIREAPTSEGGMARFDLTFVRAENRRYPTAVEDSPATADAAAKAAKLSAGDAFAADWLLTGKPGFIADRAVARLTGALDATWAKLARASQGLGDFTANLIGNYQALRAGLQDLVRTPRILADQIATLFELPAELSTAAARDFQAAFAFVFDMSRRINQADFEQSVMPPVGAGLVMFGTGTLVPESSPTRQAVRQLADASDQLFETLALAAYVQAGGSVALASYDDALAQRTLIATQCRRLLERASAAPAPAVRPASAWHDAVVALQTTALRDLQQRSIDLVRLTTYTPQAWVPVWQVSFELFGTAAYADEILAMNPHIRNPLLVPPGRPLRIVRHG